MRVSPLAFVIAVSCASFEALASGVPLALEEVFVTARKQREHLSDAALSLSVVSADAARDQHLATVDQLTEREPNLNLNKSYGNSNPVVVVRGVGLQDYNVNNSPSVGIYSDEVYLPSNAMADVALLDIERIELLKGPQGTLWGRNTTGGAINVVSRAPTADFEAAVDAGYGNHDTASSSAVVSGALAERLRARIAGLIENRGSGVFYSRARGEHAGEYSRWAVRGATQWDATENSTYLLRVGASRHRGDSYPFAHVGIAGTQCPIALAVPGEGRRDETRCTNTTTGYSDPDGDPYRGDWNAWPRTEIETISAALRAEFALGSTQITSITAFNETDFRRGEDDDTSALPLLEIRYRSDIRVVSEELRWQSGPEAMRRWLLGVAASRHTHDEHRIAHLSGLFGPLMEGAQLDYDQRIVALAAFGEGVLPLTSQLRLRSGVRFTREDLEFTGGTQPGPGAFDPAFVAIAFPGLPATAEVERTFEDVSGRVTLEWKPTASLLVYGSYSQAFKSGGVFGGFGLSPQAFVPYEPEKIHAFELGARWTANPQLRWDSALFHYDYRDLQGQVLVTATTGSLPQLTNVGDARIIGLESSLQWLPADRLAVTFGVGLLDTKLREDIVALDSLQRPIDLEGRKLPHAPKLSANATARYEWPVSLDQVLAASLDLAYRGPYEGDLPNQAHLRQTRSTLLVGGRLAWRTVETWEVALWGRNLTNERYLLHSNSSGIGNDLLMYAEPRGYGVQISRRWQ